MQYVGTNSKRRFTQKNHQLTTATKKANQHTGKARRDQSANGCGWRKPIKSMR